MSDEFVIKNPFTARMTAEELQILQESVIDVCPDIAPEDMTNRRYLVRLNELAISKGKKILVKDPEHEAQIQTITNENNRLQILLGQKNAAINQLNDDCEVLKNNSLALADELSKSSIEISTLQTSVPADDQVLITIPPLIRKVLEIEAVEAKKLTKKEWSIEDVLVQSFWVSVTEDRVYPFCNWSKSKLEALAKQLQVKTDE